MATKTKKSGVDDLLDSADKALEKTTAWDAFLGGLGARDRTNVERHLTAAETKGPAEHPKLWGRLARSLATLAPHATQTTGQQAVSFFIPDGKYRMQVFAIEDQLDGKLLIYAEDVIDSAVKANLIGKPKKGEETYPINEHDGQSVQIELLTAQNTPNPAPFYKHMLGWNRKAIRISLPVDASDPQAKTAERLCAIAAQRWLAKAE